MKIMHGFIDPFSIGLLIAIIGGSTAYVVHKDDSRLPDESNNNYESSALKGASPVEVRHILPEG